MATEAASQGFQLRPQFLEVIDLAVEGDDEAATGRRHGLMPRLADIDDRQPAMAERHGCPA
jgi:hypothetical protein